MMHFPVRKNRLIPAVLFLFCFSRTLFAAGRPVVTNISASAGTGKLINVSWTLPSKPEQPVTSLIVFRDVKPIASYSQLAALEPAATLGGGDTGWSDSAADYADYYYAVIAVTGSGRYDIIIPSMNATVNGAHRKLPQQNAAADTSASAKEKLYPQGTMRETPLPYVDLLEGTNTSGTHMGKQAQDQAKLLAGNTAEYAAAKKAKPLDVYVFEEDLVSPDGGDDYFLFDALRTTFIRKKYTESAAALNKLLGTNRSEGVTRRAKFYLGESYYFSGNYQEAVKTFLTVSDVYPVLTKKWIDSSLDFMNIPAGDIPPADVSQ
ncbi:MAG TPA: hypothetical protein DCL73_00625 [Treponema sp.]|nr:hypothetical protein [Treponema sp.]